ncbi:MAG: putative baseplate assembly protein [Acidobacteria bacterium]|nr:MAG: putative baseplate assembly protein [Acidobacteriota bacterium]
MNKPNLSCLEERRREEVRAANLFGLDYVELVDDSQTTLNVFFLGKAPQKIDKSNVVLSGGRRIRDVRITSVRAMRQPDPTLDDYLEVHVNKPGDFSQYTISVVNANQNGHPSESMDGFDSRYSQVCFRFKASCPTDLDCKAPCTCATPKRQQPDIDYLAKDYGSFRRLILDRMALVMPDWRERHEPDLGITLVELLSYAGDYLSYYQDAVATEAYLGTARQRISVRRHVRLVDYAMHEGCNARAWLTLQTGTDQELDPTQVYFITRFPGSPAEHVLSRTDLVNVSASAYEVFEPLYWNGREKISVFAAHSTIFFYTWGDCECCLAPGATSATLLDGWEPHATPEVRVEQPDPTQTKPPSTAPAAKVLPSRQSAVRAQASNDAPPEKLRRLRHLKPGDILIFKEILGPKTGKDTDADPTHRQAVRLTKVTRGIDPLYGQPDGTPIVEIEWASEDALTFPLCISSQQPPPDCGCMENVSIALGNVILVDHGSHSRETLGVVPTDSTTPKCTKCCEPAEIAISSGLFRPTLTQNRLTFSMPLPKPCSARELIRQDARQALPWISLTSIPPAPACADPMPDPKPPCEVQPLFTFEDHEDPTGLATTLQHPATPSGEFLFAQLSPATQKHIKGWDGSLPLPSSIRTALIHDLEGLFQTWTPKLDLLESGADDLNFVAEVDNDVCAHLRFGDGVCGYQPDAGTLFLSDYRIGNGRAGNVGAETITYAVFRDQKVNGVDLTPTNPFPASGGVDPEPIDDVKLFAPYAFRNQLERAITADDYASIAKDNERRLESRAALEAGDPEICSAAFTRLQSAKGALQWTGSWYTALVAVDPAETETPDDELIDEITMYLEPFRRMGHDLLVSRAEYIPLKLAITVCVLSNFLRGHVESAVADALSNRVLPNGSLGFFHPDKLTFGDGVYVSQLLATVQAVPGVQNAMVTELERFETSEPTVDLPGEELPHNSALLLGAFEIARLDNDPNYPENGVLILDMRGGR